CVRGGPPGGLRPRHVPLPGAARRLGGARRAAARSGRRPPTLWVSPASRPAPPRGLSRESQTGLPLVSRGGARGAAAPPSAPRRPGDTAGGPGPDQRALVAGLLARHTGGL